jgi:hypothetical protein
MLGSAFIATEHSAREWNRHARAVYRCVRSAFKKLDSQGFFGTGQGREKVVLMYFVLDDTTELDTIRDLNPKTVWQPVIKQLQASLPTKN